MKLKVVLTPQAESEVQELHRFGLEMLEGLIERIRSNPDDGVVPSDGPFKGIMTQVERRSRPPVVPYLGIGYQVDHAKGHIVVLSIGVFKGDPLLSC